MLGNRWTSAEEIAAEVGSPVEDVKADLDLLFAPPKQD
jgi:hypothetical protein